MPGKVWETLHAWDCGAHQSCFIMHFFCSDCVCITISFVVFACIFMCKVAPLVHVLTSET